MGARESLNTVQHRGSFPVRTPHAIRAPRLMLVYPVVGMNVDVFAGTRLRRPKDTRVPLSSRIASPSPFKRSMAVYRTSRDVGRLPSNAIVASVHARTSQAPA